MNKKSIIATLIALVLACIVVIIGRHPYSVYAKIIGINNISKSPHELYNVYLGGKSLGIIKSKKELENYIDKKQQEIKDKYNVDKVYAPSDLKIMKEITYNNKISTVEEIYKKLESIRKDSSFTIDGYKIIINGIDKKEEDGTVIKGEDKVLYVLDKKIFENSTKTTITAFIDNDKYNSYINDTQEKLKDNEVGSYIDNLYIDNNIRITKERIPAEGNIYTTEEELSKFLLFGTTAEQETYVVKSGDTISSIANNNKLSVDEFLIANTEFKSATDLLYEGQVVKLGLIEPQFDLIEIETVAEERTINKQTVYKDDNNQFIGYEKVEEEGSDGKALVTEKRQIVNGVVHDSIQTSQVELVPAINKVVVRGTKQQSYNYGTELEVPVGIGSWVWPTNTPYSINSPFGWRGGKLHEGVDIGGTGYGSPIKAANNGVVVQSGYTGINGNYITIKHANNYYTMYAHLANRYKQVGDVVMAGDQIGTMGQTGYAFGVHLHFAIYNGFPYRGGVPMNPFGNVYR